jgi:hypothetical protein
MSAVAPRRATRGSEAAPLAVKTPGFDDPSR